MKRTVEVDGFVYIHISVFLRQDQGYDFSLVSNLFSYQTILIMNGSVRELMLDLFDNQTHKEFRVRFYLMPAKSMKFNQTITIKFD